MKKLTKLMTAAGCALLIGGGLSLYAATRASGGIQPLADETVPVALLYSANDWAERYAVWNGGDANSGITGSGSGMHNIVFDYDPVTKTAKKFKDQYAQISGTITVTKAGDPSFEDKITSLSVNWYYITNQGFLTDGYAIALNGGSWWQYTAGDYTIDVPANLVEFEDGTWNQACSMTFSVLGSMSANWTVNSAYIPSENIEKGITFTFDDVTNVTLADPSVDFTVGIFEGNGWEPSQTDPYPSSNLSINGNEVTIKNVQVTDGQKFRITFPEGYFKGSNDSGNYLSTATSKDYTVWGGMPATANCLTRFPNYITEWDELTLQWPGQAITLPGGEMEGNINVTFNVSYSDVTKSLPCKIVESDQEGTNNLIIYDLTSQIEPGNYNAAVTVSLAEGAVVNTSNQPNLPQQVASFNYVSLFNPTDGTITQTITNSNGIVKIAYTDGTANVWNISQTQGIYPFAEVLDGENVFTTLSYGDFETIPYDMENPEYGLTLELNNIKGLLPNKDYTLRINTFAFNLFGSFTPAYLYSPEITTTINNKVELAGNGLGEGELYPLSVYYAAPEYNQPATYFTVQWGDGQTPIKVYDPTKISGNVKGLKMTGITVEETNYPVNGLKVNIPEAYQSNYCEFTFTLEPGLVYDTENNESNETTEIVFETYGLIDSNYATVSPAQGQVTSEELSQVEITWEGFENNVDEMTFTKGEGEITVRIGTSPNSEPIDPQHITYEKDKLVIDLSYLDITNQAYAIYVSTGAVVVSTDMGNNWINSLVTVDYNVWDGMEEAEVEGLTGMVSEETALASDGIYTLTWGKNVTPTDDFKVTFNFMAGSLSGFEDLTQDAITFLNEDMQPVANWSEGGMFLQVNAKELIESKIGEEFTLFWFNIDAGSVEGGSASAINPKQQFGVFQIQELAETLATISGPEDGIVTIAWSKAYWVASINNAPGIQLVNSNGEVVGQWSFKTEVWQSPLVTYDEESPLQFVINSGDYACGFELNLNALDLPFDTYTVVLPEGTLYLVDTNLRNSEGYNPPINAPQTSDPFEFGAYPAYEGEITIIPEVGTVAELTTVTVTFVDATEVELVENPYVNGKQMTEGFTVEGNVITIVPGINEDGEVTVTIPAGAVIIDGQFTNEEAIVATYTIDIDSGIAGVYAVDGRYEVYTVNGVLVLSTKDASDLNKLENGLYIINGQKVYIRK